MRSDKRLLLCFDNSVELCFFNIKVSLRNKYFMIKILRICCL